MNDDMPWVNLAQEEVEELRKQKHELTEYGKQKLRELMSKPIEAKVSEEDYNKVVNALSLTHEDMLEEAERRERSNTVLARYNAFYNDECSGMPHGTPITPEHMQAMALQCMVDALICENLNVEYNAIAIDDIKDLIARLYQQSNEYLKRVQEFKDSADGVA
jgi:DNA polymerase II large subunit